MNTNGYVLQDNVSYSGNNIRTINAINIDNPGHLKKCVDACNNDNNCLGFVHDNSKCYLKKNFINKNNNSSVITYFKNNIQSTLPTAILKINEKLQEGQIKYSDNRKFFIILEKDGELSIYNQDETRLWTSGKKSSLNVYLIMQSDGNLCVIDRENTKIWCSESIGLNRNYASIDNDGVLRIYNTSKQIVWSSSNNPNLLTQSVKEELQVVDFDYSKDSVPVFVIGDYGIGPWGKNTSVFTSSSGSQNIKTAKWIWYTQYSNTKSPKNTEVTIQYIYQNYSGIELKIKLYVIIDNGCGFYLNNKFIRNLSGGWSQNPNSLDIIISPGSNLFEFKLKNTGEHGGLIVSARTLGIGPDNDELLFCSDKTWKFVPVKPSPITICNLSQTNLITDTDKYFPYGCLNLNGSSQYVDIGNTITGMNGLSFGCWFKSKSNNNAKIFDFGNGVANDNIFLSIYNNYLSPGVYINNIRYGDQMIQKNVNDDNWNHVVWTIQPTFNESGLVPWSIYLNGQLLLQTLGGYPSNITRTKCYLGKSNWNTNPYLVGSISNFVIYQKVLSMKEITLLYNSMINTNDPSLYIYLPFSTNSFLDTILNNFAGKQFSLPVKLSEVKNENWNCLQEGSNWLSVKMQGNNPVCMSVDGKECVTSSETDCTTRNTNPVMPEKYIVCNETTNAEWCGSAKKLLSSPDTQTTGTMGTMGTMGTAYSTTDPNAIPINEIKPSIVALTALQTNSESESINLKPLAGGGKVLSIGTMVDVNKLLVGGVFKLRVNLPMMPPYIKGQNFDTNTGVNPNYFYLSVEKLDNNCSVKTSNGTCLNTYADNKNCSSKALTSYTQSNSYRLVLISSQYALDPSIPMGKNTDFTLVNIGNQLYLKNVQTGYLPSLYSFDSNILVYGDMMINSNTNINNAQESITNTLCDQQIPQVQTTGSRYIRCNVQADPSQYLVTTKNFGDSSPIRININSDKTISLNLLEFNKYGNPTKIYALTYCNFNVNTFSYIEKMTNTLGTFLVNMVCFMETQDTRASTKNQLNFTIELVSFPPDFVKDNSVFTIN